MGTVHAGLYSDTKAIIVSRFSVSRLWLRRWTRQRGVSLSICAPYTEESGWDKLHRSLAYDFAYHRRASSADREDSGRD